VEIIGVIIAGIIIGLLGKWVAPGSRDNTPLWLTILCGIGGVLIGYYIAAALGVEATAGVGCINHMGCLGQTMTEPMEKWCGKLLLSLHSASRRWCLRCRPRRRSTRSFVLSCRVTGTPAATPGVRVTDCLTMRPGGARRRSSPGSTTGRCGHGSAARVGVWQALAGDDGLVIQGDVR
jgi:uncharacterized membrane protein YeaQ/YmgE (transglycosylase-associated protein family)